MNEEVDLRLKHPFGMILSGPSGCGKSHFVARLLQQVSHMMVPVPEKIHWCYAKDQPLYDSLRRTSPLPIEFHQGIPPDMEGMMQNSQKQVFVLDDLMNEIATSQ
jgi:septin family protein